MVTNKISLDTNVRDGVLKFSWKSVKLFLGQFFLSKVYLVLRLLLLWIFFTKMILEILDFPFYKKQITCGYEGYEIRFAGYIGDCCEGYKYKNRNILWEILRDCNKLQAERYTIASKNYSSSFMSGSITHSDIEIVESNVFKMSQCMI